MRIAFVLHTLNVGGAQRATVNLANQFAALGWCTHIYLLSTQSSVAYVLDDRVEVNFASLDRVSKNTFSAIINNANRVLKIRKWLAHNEIDLTIGMSYTANVLISIASLGTKIVTMGSERSHPEYRQTGWAWRSLRKLIYGRMDRFVCLTQDTAEWLLRNTGLSNVVVIPNGIQLPLEGTTPLVKVSSIVNDKRIILSVGRLISTKQFDHLIDSFSLLSDEFDGWNLYIAGDGPERASLLRQISSLGLEKRVVLLGSVGNLSDWYVAADVFVFPSRLEGFPNSLLEAMAYGLACVSYDCKAGPRDLIQHEINGELVPLNDQVALQNSMRRLLMDEIYLTSIAEQAAKCATEYSIEIISGKWIQLIKESIGNDDRVAR